MKCADLFCGAGGAAMGLHRAGFEVVGFDIKPQPSYPFEFHQQDALTIDLNGFDFVWASPPCQAYSLGSLRWPTRHPDLIPATRGKLMKWGGPWIIENVPRAPLIQPILLCGTMFGLKVIRHRLFESSMFLMTPAHNCASRGATKRKEYVTCAGHGGFGSNALPVWQEAMGINWTSKQELSQAVPPAYSEFLGRQILQTRNPAEGS